MTHSAQRPCVVITCFTDSYVVGVKFQSAVDAHAQRHDHEDTGRLTPVTDTVLTLDPTFNCDDDPTSIIEDLSAFSVFDCLKTRFECRQIGTNVEVPIARLNGLSSAY